MLFLNENEKKRNYYTRIMEVDQTGGGIGEHRSLLLYLRGSQQVLKIIDKNCYTSSTFGYF